MSDIKMRGPKGCADTLSHAGESYAADKKGIFTVPVEAYESLSRHGFIAVGEQPADAVEAPQS
ncbi:MAG: hypothetical protein KGH75_13455 [Rhodospirillales bacterium]|nr:hypothetical protein [Rhodospirillales bacterium]